LHNDIYFRLLPLPIATLLFFHFKKQTMLKQFLLRRNILMAAVGLFIAGVFTSCLKDNDFQQTPVSGLMAFNLAPDQEAVGISLSGSLLGGTPLGYGSFTGTYLNVYSGNRRVDSYAGNELLDSSTYNFGKDKYYSVFVVGTNNNYQNIVVQDNYDSLTASSGKAYIRYINAIPAPASSNVNITSGGSSVFNTNEAFGQVSPFVEVTPGSLSVEVTGEGSVNRTITVAGQKAYTILLMGMPNQTDTTKAVQIRFIENGTITD
jgi:hypothetical protein